jgi:hypothetical protein
VVGDLYLCVEVRVCRKCGVPQRSRVMRVQQGSRVVSPRYPANRGSKGCAWDSACARCSL